MADEESFFKPGLFAFLAREFSEIRRRAFWCAAFLVVASSILIGCPHWEDSYVMRISMMAENALLPAGVHLYYQKLMEVMLVNFKISLVLAIAASVPLLAYHFVAFTAPALDRGYRTFYLGFVAAAVGLFALGILLTSVFFLPLTVKMLVHYGMASGVQPMLSVDEFYSFVFLFLLVFALPFEMPLLIGFLHRFNLVPAATFKSLRFKIYGVILIVSQFVTPDPLITPTIFSVMNIALYEAGILLCRWL